MAHKKGKRDMVAEARKRDTRVKKAQSRSKTAVGKGVGALRANKSKKSGY